MPVCFDIESSTGSYGITIGEGLFEALLHEPGERLVIADDFFAGRLARAGIEFIAIPADETSKSLDKMTALVEAMKDRKATRNTCLVAIGGGVVQDCASFASSIYMRGTPWIYVPTTLLGMADSCIGGKSSINVGKYKNIVGTFHPPERIVADPDFVGSLSAEQRIAGLCEAAKIAICRGLDTFERYLEIDPSPGMPDERFADVVELCLRAKKWFIEIDEFDRKERLILNFGHTFGHAIEAASDFRVSHGVAVGLGMVAASHLASALGIAASPDPRVTAFDRHIRGLLAGVPGLADALGGVELAELMDAFAADKKHSREQFAVILINGDGAVERMLLDRTDAVAAEISESFARLLREFS